MSTVDRVFGVDGEECRRWWKENAPQGVEYGFCWCGQKTPLSEDTHRKYGYIGGEPKRYVHLHAHPNSRPKPAPEYEPMSEFDSGCVIYREGKGNRKPHWIRSSERIDEVTDLMIAVRAHVGARRRERIDESLANCGGREAA